MVTKETKGYPCKGNHGMLPEVTRTKEKGTKARPAETAKRSLAKNYRVNSIYNSIICNSIQELTGKEMMMFWHLLYISLDW